MTHEELINQTLIILGKNAMHVGRFWKQHTGRAFQIVDGTRRYISYGVSGGGDISGLIVGGIRVELEGKVGRDIQRPNQKAFEEMIKRFGGHYFLFKSPENALDYILRIANGSRL